MGSQHKKILETLFDVYKDTGYVTEDVVLDVMSQYNLSLDEVDHICDCLLSMGAIIHEGNYNNERDEDDEYDRSQTDYDKLFNDVIEVENCLEPFISEVRQIKPPQHREWKFFMPQAKSGNIFAKHRLIEMYLRVVVRIAFWHYQKYKFPLPETLQDGCVGLIIALEKYEPDRQDNFSTYAPWWIRQSIMRNAGMINSSMYFPAHIKNKLFSIYELAEFNRTDFDFSSEVLLQAVSKKLCCSENEAKDYFNLLTPFQSIECLLDKNEEIFYTNILDENVCEEIARGELKRTIYQALQTLTSRERTVVQLRFGLLSGKEMTLEEVGTLMGVTRERIRQIEKKALIKLRHPSRSKKIKAIIS